jgi:hypothetical protein
MKTKIVKASAKDIQNLIDLQLSRSISHSKGRQLVREILLRLSSHQDHQSRTENLAREAREMAVFHAEAQITATLKTVASSVISECILTAFDVVTVSVVNQLYICRQFNLKVLESFENERDLVLSEGALSQKLKLLIAIVIDMEHSAQQHNCPRSKSHETWSDEGQDR